MGEYEVDARMRDGPRTAPPVMRPSAELAAGSAALAPTAVEFLPRWGGNAGVATPLAVRREGQAGSAFRRVINSAVEPPGDGVRGHTDHAHGAARSEVQADDDDGAAAAGHGQQTRASVDGSEPEEAEPETSRGSGVPT